MATSGSFNFAASTYGPGVGYPNYAKITWSASWNQSTLQWYVEWNATAQGASTAGRYTTVYGSNNNCNSYITVKDENGNTLDSKTIVARMDNVKNNTVLLSGSFNVGVTDLGERSLAFSGQIYFETTGSAGISSGSQTFALDTKPLASTISSISPSNVTVGTSGGAVTVNISRASASYTHTVVYTFGSNSTTHTSVGTSDSYTIPASWLAAIPSSVSGTATVTVTTFNGATQIGSPVSANFTITAGVTPTIGSLSVAPRGTSYNAGITSAYIAGYTTALITASSVSGANGSTISKVEFLRDGSVISTNTTPTYTYTTGTLTGSAATFSVRVTDSRGKIATASASQITIQAYAVPAFSLTSVYRSNSSGTADSSGTYCYIKTTASATPGANSITALSFATKLTTASTYGSEVSLTSGTAKIQSGFSATSSYDIRLKATDKLGNISYYYAMIPTEVYTMDFKVGGKAVSFGKVAELDQTVESAWPIKAPNLLEFH